MNGNEVLIAFVKFFKEGVLQQTEQSDQWKRLSVVIIKGSNEPTRE